MTLIHSTRRIERFHHVHEVTYLIDMPTRRTFWCTRDDGLYVWLLIARTVSAAISALAWQNSYRHYFSIYCEGEFELLAKQTAAFLAAVLQEDLDGNIVENYQIRSRHFVTGKPSNTLDKK